MDVRHPALVLGLGETGLAVVRALGRAGVRVLGLDRRRRIGFRSRYVSPRVCPDPRANPEGFLDALVSLARSCSAPPVVFTTADPFLRPIARSWDELRRHCLLLAPPPAAVDRLLDKHRLHAWCVDAGIAVPRSVHVTSRHELDERLSSLRFPVFVKPSTAALRGGAFQGPAKGMLARGHGELLQAIERGTNGGADVIVQEVVEGPDTNCMKYCALVAPDGDRLLEFMLQKLRNFPAHFGVGSCCVSRFEPEILALGRGILGKVGYRGVGSIEFKRDARDGLWKLIEVNARYWQQVALAEACGMNFPLIHYLAATGQPIPAPTGFAIGVKWLDPVMDLASCLAYRREGLLTWTGWRRSLQGPRVIAGAALDDPWPLLASEKPWKIAARSAALLGRFLVP